MKTNKGLGVLVVASAIVLFSYMPGKHQDYHGYAKKKTRQQASLEEIYRQCVPDNMPNIKFNPDSYFDSYFEEKYSHTGHKLYVVFGYHYARDAARHIFSRVVPDLVKEPSGWLFLVEGKEFDSGPENCFALHLAEKYHIPVDDVIVKDVNARVIKKVQEQGFSEDEVYTKLLFARYVVSKAVNSSLSKNSLIADANARKHAVQEVSWETGRNRAYLESLLNDYIDNFSLERCARMRKVDSSILEVRNGISRERLEELLSCPSTPKKILLVIGGAHYCITDDL